jgi:hypothetical protein
VMRPNDTADAEPYRYPNDVEYNPKHCRLTEREFQSRIRAGL